MAPGLIGVANGSSGGQRSTAIHRPDILLDLFNACLISGTFCGRWKKARLVLLSKGKGDPDSPSAYRPLALLDMTGKLFELLLRPRLTNAIAASGGLSDRQYGFRKGRSTIGAIQEVVDAYQRTREKCDQARPLVLLALLDIKNAFNSARWVDILEALDKAFRVPGYLVRIVEDYLRNRQIIFETTDGTETMIVTAGVAQGSILGPDFWNALYDDLLRIELPDGCYIVAYADDAPK